MRTGRPLSAFYTPLQRSTSERKEAGMGMKRIEAPMAATLLQIAVAPGQSLRRGDLLLVVEAMKMEHVLTAPVAGTVTELVVTAGHQVRLDERVAVVTPPAPGEGE
jgi:acetyl-CoA/propionyl-CoA carboxylase, biotin carboxylase, biotin carboxyl carrier protein